MTLFLVWMAIAGAMAQHRGPVEARLPDGTDVLWVEDTTATRTHLVWTLGLGSAGREAPEEVMLLMDVLDEGTRHHRGPRWRWELGRVGATVRMGVSPHRIWFWLDAPIGEEAGAVRLLAEALDSPQLRRGAILDALQERRSHDEGFHGLRRVAEHARDAELARLGCPTAPSIDWSKVRRFGIRSRLRERHRQVFMAGQSALLIMGPRPPAEIFDSLRPLLGRGGIEAPLVCAEPVTDGDGPRLIVVDRPGQQAYLWSLQPVRTAHVDVLEQVHWALMGGYSSRLYTTLRDHAGLTYGSTSRITEMPGLRVLELEVETHVESAVETLVRTETLLAELMQEGFTEDELRIARYQLAQTDRRLQLDTDRYVRETSWQQFLGGIGPDEQAVFSTREILDVSRELSSNTDRTWILVGDLDRLQEDLLTRGFEITDIRHGRGSW